MGFYMHRPWFPGCNEYNESCSRKYQYRKILDFIFQLKPRFPTPSTVYFTVSNIGGHCDIYISNTVLGFDVSDMTLDL